MRGAPNFAERKERAFRAPVTIDARQNRHPRAPLFAAALPSLTQPGPAPVAPSVIRRKEHSMIALYDHIQELRVELRGCCMARNERARVQAELALAVAEQAGLDGEFDRDFEAYSEERS
jgi:hypothetical protein